MSDKIVRIRGRNRTSASDTTWSRIKIAIEESLAYAAVSVEQLVARAKIEGRRPHPGIVNALVAYRDAVKEVDAVNCAQRRQYDWRRDMEICDALDAAEVALNRPDWHGVSHQYVKAMHRTIAEMRKATQERHLAMKQQDTGTG